MSCEIPKKEICFDEGVEDRLFWLIPNIDVDPLGYTLKIGEQTLTGTAEVNSDGVLVSFQVPSLSKGVYNGYMVTNTKVQGKFHQLKLVVKVVPTVDAV